MKVYWKLECICFLLWISILLCNFYHFFLNIYNFQNKFFPWILNVSLEKKSPNSNEQNRLRFPMTHELTTLLAPAAAAALLFLLLASFLRPSLHYSCILAPIDQKKRSSSYKHVWFPSPSPQKKKKPPAAEDPTRESSKTCHRFPSQEPEPLESCWFKTDIHTKQTDRERERERERE